MQLEIEFQSSDATQDIYELRNFLQEQMPDLNVNLKVLPPLEGQMVAGTVSGIIISGLIEAIAGESIHELYNRVLRPRITSWLNAKHNPNTPKLEVLSTLKTSDARVHFSQSSTGETKVYDNVNYAIDTDRTYAILIGSSEFEGNFTPIPPVQGNLEDLYRLLTDKRHIGLPPENVTVAHNKSNTEIEELLLRNSRRPGMETFIVYYTGHGHRTDVKKLYLVARNTKRIDDYILGGIDLDFIQKAILKSSTASQKILILDACHSGIATQGSDTLFADIDVKGTYTLSSSPGDEVSYFDKNGRNTFFTGVLLDILSHGIDNTNEMLALDDLYDHARFQLQQRNFPHPISKSQLNIPPSQFFIARNPSFSVEKLKRKPSMLFHQGKLQDALYEYEILLQKYPDDLALRNEAEHCRTQVLFTQLVNDADELFYQYHNYRAAHNKYRKAFQIKQDAVIHNKIAKCEERMQGTTQDAPINEDVADNQSSDTHTSTKSDLRREDIKEKTREQKPDMRQESSQTSTTGTSGQLVKPASNIPLIIAVGWTLFSVFFFFTGWITLDRTMWAAGILCVTLICLGFRIKTLTSTELILYSYPLILSIIYLAATLAYRDGLMVLGFLLFGTSAFLILRMMKKRLAGFHILHVVFGSIAIIYFFMKIVVVSLLAMSGDPYDSYTLQNHFQTGSVIGAILGLGFSIDLYLAWLRNRKPSISDTAQKGASRTINIPQLSRMTGIVLASIWLSLVIMTYHYR